MKNSINLTVVFAIGLFLILGCGSANTSTTSKPVDTSNLSGTAPPNAPAVPAPNEKPIAIKATALTKEYDENELAADGKYKGKMIAVSGKIENIAETMGNVTVQLAGHNIAKNVMCNFDESEKANVAKLKKGQQATFVGTGDGMTLGLYAGLKSCKIQ